MQLLVWTALIICPWWCVREPSPKNACFIASIKLILFVLLFARLIYLRDLCLHLNFFFLLQRSTWRKHSQTPGRSFLQRQKKTENEWKVKQYATAAHLSISNISTTSPVSCLWTDTLGFPSSYMTFSSVFVGLPHFSLHSKTKWITASEDRWQFCQICNHHLLHFSEVYFVFC